MTAAVGASPTKEQFAAQVDRTFRITGPEDKVFDAVLVEYKDELDTDTQETFSLIFKAPTQAPNQQSIYKLENEDIGEQEMFLVPIGQDESGLRYQAVYNRFKQ